MPVLLKPEAYYSSPHISAVPAPRNTVAPRKRPSHPNWLSKRLMSIAEHLSARQLILYYECKYMSRLGMQLLLCAAHGVAHGRPFCDVHISVYTSIHVREGPVPRDTDDDGNIEMKGERDTTRRRLRQRGKGLVTRMTTLCRQTC